MSSDFDLTTLKYCYAQPMPRTIIYPSFMNILYIDFIYKTIKESHKRQGKLKQQKHKIRPNVQQYLYILCHRRKPRRSSIGCPGKSCPGG